MSAPRRAPAGARRQQPPAEEKKKSRAYAILAGGGVKGAALVGALKAAEDYGFEFEGYGGASAGSLVALFASIKPPDPPPEPPAEPGDKRRPKKDLLYELIVEKNFCGMFDDNSGAAVKGLQDMRVRRYIPHAYRVFSDSWTLNKIRSRLGIYAGGSLETFVRNTVFEVEGYKDLRAAGDFNFRQLRERGGKLLKVVASDISNKRAVTYPDPKGRAEESVVRAVRASVSFPFVFKPVAQPPEREGEGVSYLVDGGLCSNLPVFLFANEHKQTGFPILAFDLIAYGKGVERGGRYGLRDYCGDLLSTALEASDEIQRRTIQDLTGNRFCYIPIQIPRDIRTFDADIKPEDSVALYDAAYRQTMQELKRTFPDLPYAETAVDAKQSVLNVPASLIEPLLKGLALEMEEVTDARNLRVHVMLPVERERLTITYQYGMRADDPDRHTEVGPRSKWMQHVFVMKQPTLSDLDKLRANPAAWGMTPEEVARIRADRKALISFPILKSSPSAEKVSDYDCAGILSVDTDTPLEYTSWHFMRGSKATAAMKRWADIITRMLY